MIITFQNHNQAKIQADNTTLSNQILDKSQKCQDTTQKPGEESSYSNKSKQIHPWYIPI